MKMKASNLQLADRDYELFRYLHAVKVATYDQIRRDIYPEICLDAVGNRIRKMEDAKLIDVGRNRLILKGKRYVSIRKNTFEEYVRKGGELQIELKSDALQHDLTLVDIRYLLMKSAKTVGYQTENQIQTWSIKHKYLNCDAIVTTRLKDSEFLIPIEYESNLKKADRYEPFLKKYYSAEDFPLVAFIADSSSIIETVMKLEKQLFNWDKPKFFYRLKHDWLADDALSLENCNNAVLSLGDR